MPIEPGNQATDLPARLIQIVARDAWLMPILRAAREQNLPDWCIAGGAIRNAIWDELHGHTQRNFPSDIDLLFFDAAGDFDEAAIERALQQQMPDVQWEPVNQAQIHTYNRDRPYVSTYDAMGRWAETATAVGIRLNADESLEVVAPLGLDDLFGIVARPHLAAPGAARVYRERMRTKGWSEKWPQLRVIWPDEAA